MKNKVKKVFRVISEVWVDPSIESDKYLKDTILERFEGTNDGFPIRGKYGAVIGWGIKHVKVIPLVLRKSDK